MEKMDTLSRTYLALRLVFVLREVLDKVRDKVRDKGFLFFERTQ